MTNPPIQVTTNLSKILDRIDENLNDFRKQTNKKLEKIDERLTKIEVSQVRLESDVSTLKEDIKELKGSTKAQIWTLIGMLGTGVIGTIIRFVITAYPSNP